MTSENQTRNTFKVRHVKHAKQKIKHVTLFKVRHVKHVTQKIKHVTL